MKRFFSFIGATGRAFVALVGICGISVFAANYTMTQGSGTTFGSIVVGGVNYAQQLICDLTTPSQCAAVDGSGFLSVKSTTLSTAANQSTEITALNSIVNNTGAAVPSGTARIGYTSDDPCNNATAKVYTPISQTANAKLITGTSAKKTYICSLMIIASDAENVSLIEGTGSTCGTNPVAVIGGATAANGMNMAANGGFTFGSGTGSIAATSVNADDTCLFQSGSGRVSGAIVTATQ